MQDLVKLFWITVQALVASLLHLLLSCKTQVRFISMILESKFFYKLDSDLKERVSRITKLNLINKSLPRN